MPKLVPIGRTFAKIWPIFDFSSWRPSAILDLFYVWPPTKSITVFVGVCHRAKFASNRCSSFDNMPVLMFSEFGLKMLIHAYFWVVLGDLTSRYEPIWTNLPKIKSAGHSGSSGVLIMQLSVLVFWEIAWTKKVWRRRRRRRKENKNKKKKNKNKNKNENKKTAVDRRNVHVMLVCNVTHTLRPQ